MWNQKRSLLLSRVCVRLFLITLTAVVLTAPMLVDWYIALRPVSFQALRMPLIIVIYACCPPAYFLLLSLGSFLKNIAADKVFIRDNVSLLRRISWACIFLGLLLLFSSAVSPAFLLISIAAAFVGLICRVIKNVFAQAVELQQEADFTI